MDIWTPSKGTEISSGFRGITTPLNELIEEINGRGWELNSIDYKQNGFVATGKNPHGESMEATGITDATAAANLLLKIMRRETIREAPIAKLAQWSQDWSNNLEEIAKAYAKAPIYDPKAAPAWKALADDSVRRAEVLKQQLKVEIVPDPEPYETPQEMCEDVHKNQHFLVSSANSQHPMWSTEQNVAFRIVHDVLGHCVSGGDFGWQGENQACRAHFPLLTPLAQKALFTECIAQTAAGAYFRSFMPQKVAFIDEFIEPAMEQENPAAHQGVHPSQSVAPAAMPQVQPSTPQGLPWATQIPSPDFSGGLPVFGSAKNPRDPNHDWESGVDAMPNNAYLWANDPLQGEAVRDNAMKVHTGWWDMKNGDGSADIDSMRQAITNAFRVVLLSPRKDLRWNAIHYQDIMHVPATVTDPKRYWDALEGRRENWNQSRGYAPGSHKPYWKEFAQFRQYIRAANPDLEEWEADEKADREFFHMLSEEEDRLAADPKNEKKDADEIHRKAATEVTKRLKAILKPQSQETDYGHEQMHLLSKVKHKADQENKYYDGDNRNSLNPVEFTSLRIEGAVGGGISGDHEEKYSTQVDFEGQEAGKYGAFMGSHLKSISQISQHVDELLDAALKDIQEHDGTGHHFRSKVLSLGIPGVGPKVASFAWLLLAPGTSQLATIDTHMMDVLGHDYAKNMNNRDYFRFERELAAGRDAAGYGHVPLGQFQWGMWDYKRTGEGTHQDHSAMKVLDPIPHDQVNWAKKMPVQQSWQEPEWWTATQPARDMVAQDWQQNVATQFASDMTPRFAKRKTATSLHVPWILWGDRIWVGAPGQTFMNLAREQLGYSMEEVIQHLPEQDFAAGLFDEKSGRILPQDEITPEQQALILQAITQPV